MFKGPIFIVGTPRSGTTVFSNKLTSVTGIVIAPETHFMAEVWSPLRHLDLADERSLNTAITRFSSGIWFSDLGIEEEQIKNEFLKQAELTWPVFFNIVLKLYADSKQAKYYGEKTPGHYHYVSNFLDWYPDCRVIFMMRDPRAVVASNLRAPFSPSYVWFVARRWKQVANIHQQHQSDPRVLKVCYENFVADPETLLTRLCQNLGIEPATQQMHSSIAPATPKKSAWRTQHLLAAGSSVNKKSLSKWRKELSNYEIWLAERIAGPLMQHYGYEPETRGVRNHAANYVRYYAKYPLQRLELTIAWAMKPEWNNSLKNSPKAKLFRAIGKGLDWLYYLQFRASQFMFPKKQTSKINNLLAVVTLGARNSQPSFFLHLSTDNEKIGLFVMRVKRQGYDVWISTSSRKQFLAARKIVHAFGLEQGVRFMQTCRNSYGKNAFVEICRPDKKKIVQTFDNFEISSINAGKMPRGK